MDNSKMQERVQALRLPEPAKGAATSRLPWALCVALAGLTVWQSYVTQQRGTSSSVGPTAERSTQDAATADPNKPTAPSSRDATSNIALEDKGHLVPAHQILVSPKVSGMIVELRIAEGRRFQKHDILAVLESDEYEAEHDRAAALLKRARASRERAAARDTEATAGFRDLEKAQAEAELDEARAEQTRLVSEHKRNQLLKADGAISDFDFSQSFARWRISELRVRRLEAAFALIGEGERSERRAIAKHELAQADADVLQAEAELKKAQWRLDNCTIRAPISGMILKKNAEEGNIVNPIAFNGSFSLCDMADLSDLEVELSISERDIAAIFVGQRCAVRADAYRERLYEGVVDRVMPIADRAKASVPVRVKVQVPAEEVGVHLKPEMGVSVTFFKRENSKASSQLERAGAKVGSSRSP